MRNLASFKDVHLQRFVADKIGGISTYKLILYEIDLGTAEGVIYL